MSKIATLKSLPTPSELRQTAAQLQSLEQLPDLVAQEVSKSLAPLHLLQGEVQRVLEYYDQIAQAQRSTLEQLAQEMTNRATASLEQKAESLDKSLHDLAGQARVLKDSIERVEASSQRLQALPKGLAGAAKIAAKEMQGSSQDLARQAAKARPRWWLVMAQMLGAAVLGAVLVVAGQAVLRKLTRPGLAEAWTQASPAERAAFLNQIVSQPGQ